MEYHENKFVKLRRKYSFTLRNIIETMDNNFLNSTFPTLSKDVNKMTRRESHHVICNCLNSIYIELKGEEKK